MLPDRPGEMRPGLRGRTDEKKWVDSRYFRDKVKRTSQWYCFLRWGRERGGITGERRNQELHFGCVKLKTS